ncbi:MAG TPA: hypothetical protein V6C97_09640 [Oculatellaceae cyanobacterium]
MFEGTLGTHGDWQTERANAKEFTPLEIYNEFPDGELPPFTSLANADEAD